MAHVVSRLAATIFRIVIEIGAPLANRDTS
jgi:hypothetical protein